MSFPSAHLPQERHLTGGTGFGSDREYWVHTMDRIARPVHHRTERRQAEGEHPGRKGRKPHCPAAGNSSHTWNRVGRTIAGIAPWIELGPDDTPEGKLRAEYIDLVCKALENSVDPEADDYFDSHATRQILVNSAFLIQGLLAAPHHIWDNLDSLTQERLLAQWKSTRTMIPGKNNWYLFSAMVECGLKVFGGEWDYSIVRACDRLSQGMVCGRRSVWAVERCVGLPSRLLQQLRDTAHAAASPRSGCEIR